MEGYRAQPVAVDADSSGALVVPDLAFGSNFALGRFGSDTLKGLFSLTDVNPWREVNDVTALKSPFSIAERRFRHPRYRKRQPILFECELVRFHDGTFYDFDAVDGRLTTQVMKHHRSGPMRCALLAGG